MGSNGLHSFTERNLCEATGATREARWPELDGLRGAAILMVFLLHYVTDSRTHEGGFGSLYRFAQLFRLGWSGVDLFFVLSGFLIGGILLDARASPSYFRTFYTRRIYRILPIYYSWLTAYAISGYALMKWGSATSTAYVGYSLHAGIFFLFLQNILGIPASPFSHYMVSPTWSLAVEEQFYLVAPFLIRYLSVRTLTFVLLACVSGAPILRYFAGSDMGYVLMPCRADALAMGMLAAVAWRTAAKAWLIRRTALLKSLSAVLLVGALAMIKWMPGPRGTALEVAFQYSWLALLYTSILLTALLDSRCLVACAARWWLLRECGRVSYCVYLIHLGILGVLHRVFFGGLPHIDDWPGFAVTVLAAILTWIIARLSWKYFEKPLIDRGHAQGYVSR
jgi:peptidoglycan/LPS O-acetylase OafA/YrhL